MRILVLDNYDSFTFNLVHYLRQLGFGEQMDVYRNDQISLAEVAVYDKILLSPGPGIPSEAGILLDLIKTYGATKSILGVCLGHQAISEVYGSKLYNMPEVLHGVSSKLQVVEVNDRLFKGLPQQFTICHYHSWNVDQKHLGDELVITAKDEYGEIMAISHKIYDVKGVQFHPESILTEHGYALLKNWVNSISTKEN